MFGREEITEEGIVESVSRGIAFVRLKEKGNCNECSAKIICNTGSDKNMITASDSFGVQPGDFVKMTIPGKKIASVSNFIYGIPLLLMLAGIITGNYIFQTNKELNSALLSFLLIVLYGIIFYFYSKKIDNSSLLPRIIFVKK